jgi:dihydrofolate reductase
MISAILATTPSGGIGNRGTLPWPNHSGDMAWFKRHTSGHVVVMGRNTWDDHSMPNPLPGRMNYVISSRPLSQPYASTQHIHGDINEQLESIDHRHPDKEIFVIGGKQIYEQAHSKIQRIYLTRMSGNYFADTRLNLDSFLREFRIYSVRPGNGCTYEIWNRVFF